MKNASKIILCLLLIIALMGTQIITAIAEPVTLTIAGGLLLFAIGGALLTTLSAEQVYVNTGTQDWSKYQYDYVWQKAIDITMDAMQVWDIAQSTIDTITTKLSQSTDTVTFTADEIISMTPDIKEVLHFTLKSDYPLISTPTNLSISANKSWGLDAAQSINYYIDSIGYGDFDKTQLIAMIIMGLSKGYTDLYVAEQTHNQFAFIMSTSSNVLNDVVSELSVLATIYKDCFIISSKSGVFSYNWYEAGSTVDFGIGNALSDWNKYAVADTLSDGLSIDNIKVPVGGLSIDVPLSNTDLDNLISCDPAIIGLTPTLVTDITTGALTDTTGTGSIDEPITDTGTLTGVIDAVNDMAISLTTSITSLAGDVARFFDLTQPLNFEPLKVAGTMFSTRFPFSLPWDLYNSFASLSAPGVKPDFNIVVPDTKLLKGMKFNVDLSMFEDLIAFAKIMELLAFDIGLILITRKILGGDA